MAMVECFDKKDVDEAVDSLYVGSSSSLFIPNRCLGQITSSFEMANLACLSSAKLNVSRFPD
jgi:hypothetical protein